MMYDVFVAWALDLFYEVDSLMKLGDFTGVMISQLQFFVRFDKHHILIESSGKTSCALDRNQRSNSLQSFLMRHKGWLLLFDEFVDLYFTASTVLYQYTLLYGHSDQDGYESVLGKHYRKWWNHVSRCAENTFWSCRALDAFMQR